MNFTPDIFQAFQSKLKVGNRRTIHLNAVPGNSRYKFDLARLANIHKSLPEHFIIDLLTMSKVNFKFSIHDKPASNPVESKIINESIYLNDYEDINDTEEKPLQNSNKDVENLAILQKIASGLENIIFQNEVIQSEKGLNSLGFGFPLLIRRDLQDGQITVAPILIWSVKIKPTTEMNTWEISRTEDDPIYLNEVLINHLQSDSEVFLQPIPEEMLEDGKIDKPELFSICKTILEQLKIDQNIDFILNNYEAILPIKNKATYENMLPNRGDAFIEKSGLFSLFEVQKQNIINDYEDLIANYKDPVFLNLEKKFQSISPVETDPSQQGILESLKKKSKILIQGPPGTGKSQTLTALLINALENKQKTIVVCEKQTALEVLENAMKKHKLESFCIMIKDSTSDRKQVVDRVRNIIDNNDFKNATELFPESILQEQIDKITLSKNEINGVHHKLNQNLVNNQNWTSIIGQILECLPLKQEIDIHDFPFSFDANEWHLLIEKIEQGSNLYFKFKPYAENLIYNPLKITENDVINSQLKINEAFINYEKHWQTIQLLVNNYKDFYFSKRKEEFSNQLETLDNYKNELLVLIATLNKENDEFNNEKTESFFYKFVSWFSNSKKNVLQNRIKIKEISKNFKEISLHRNFYEINISSDLWQNIEEIKGYNEKITLAKQTFAEKIEIDFQELDLLNFYDRNFQNQDLEDINNQCKNLKTNIKNDNWLHLWNGGITFPDFKKEIETFLNKHLELQSDANNPFIFIYNWLIFYNPLSNFEQQLMQKLYAVSQWKASFNFAYFNQLLEKNTTNQLNFNEESYHSFSKKIAHFSYSQKHFIDSYWKNEQYKSVKNFEKINKDITVANLYNKRKSIKHNRLTLRQITQKDIDLFTSFFPILFITPDVCCNLFKGKNFYFDNVVFDEASQLKLEDNLPALLKARNIIIAGDEHQMPPSNYFSKVFDGSLEDEDDLTEESIITQKNSLLNIESLLDFALEYQFDKNHLDFHYRSKHPYLIDFSNHAFYKSRLKPLPSFSEIKPIDFHQINGVFHEHINEKEADKVLEILEQILPNANGKYPSVGVATFNITQRNYIKRKIVYKQSLEENEGFREKMKGLEESGFFIKNLENIQGDERDIIIISTTYGVKKDGKFIQSFGPINHSKGYKLLNVIITRAKEKIIICNSIPEAIFSNYKNALEQEGSNNRKAVFYAYLAYCKAVSEENNAQRIQVLKDLNTSKNQSQNTINLLENLFKEQVFSLLKAKFSDTEIIVNYPFAGYHLDLLIKPKNGKPIAVECLSKDNYKGELAYLEDLHKEKILKNAGYNYQRIWSHSWWKNTEKEMKKYQEMIEN